VELRQVGVRRVGRERRASCGTCRISWRAR
jgi:hypothetical protein